MGFSQEFEIIGADLRVPSNVLEGEPGFAVRLQQWLSPCDDAPAYPLPIMRVGIQRLVLNSKAGDNTVASKAAMLWEGPGGIFLETGGLNTPK